MEDGVLYTAGEFEYAALDAATGEILKRVRKEFCMDSSGAAAADGELIYIPTSEAGVAALDKKTLETVRLFPAGPAAVFTAPYILGKAQMVEGSPVIKGELLIFAANDGNVRIYNKDTAELIKTISIGAPSLVSPIVTDKHIYVTDFDGYVTKFEYL